MKRNLLFLLLMFLFFNPSNAQERGSKCYLSGTVIDTSVHYILLLKDGQSLRDVDVLKIPVRKGRFSYETIIEYPEAVTLYTNHILEKGAGRYTVLFLEEGQVNITLYAQDKFGDNRIEGGKHNQEYLRFQECLRSKYFERISAIQDSMRLLFQEGRLMSEAMKEIQKRISGNPSDIDKLKLYTEKDSLIANGLDKTVEGQHLDERRSQLVAKVKEEQAAYMNENRSIVAYKLFLDRLEDAQTIDINDLKSNYLQLSKANPGHPYNILAENIITATTNIRLNSRFVNFSAPDLQGNIFQMSEQIGSKITLLNLWATWCGPCIAKTRAILPLFEAYKDKGFTVVGVAGEYKNTDNLVKFLNREKWPWLNLVELNKKANIWRKYNVGDQAGAMFLIDTNGFIVAIDPTVDEIKMILEKQLD